VKTDLTVYQEAMANLANLALQEFQLLQLHMVVDAEFVLMGRSDHLVHLDLADPTEPQALQASQDERASQEITDPMELLEHPETLDLMESPDQRETQVDLEVQEAEVPLVPRVRQENQVNLDPQDVQELTVPKGSPGQQVLPDQRAQLEQLVNLESMELRAVQALLELMLNIALALSVLLGLSTPKPKRSIKRNCMEPPAENLS